MCYFSVISVYFGKFLIIFYTVSTSKVYHCMLIGAGHVHCMFYCDFCPALDCFYTRFCY